LEAAGGGMTGIILFAIATGVPIAIMALAGLALWGIWNED
jgi:hypothetical protein